MRAFVVRGPHGYGVQDVPEPVAGPAEVLVSPLAVGVCGADLDIVEGRRPRGYAKYPIVPGHEWSGRVIGVGPGVSGIDVGAAVVAEGVRDCGRCDRCREGRNNLCAGPYAETGFTHAGALAQRVVVPARLVHVLPEERPLAAAALIEPAAGFAGALLDVGVPRAGSRIAVIGDGPLALLALQILRLSAPAELVLLGHRPHAAATARACGASAVVPAADAVPPDSGVFAEDRELRGRFDLVADATEGASGAAGALSLARRGGTVLLVGASSGGACLLDPDVISLGQLRVQGGSSASSEAWRAVVSLFAAGMFDPTPLITHEFDLDHSDDALRVLGDADATALKVLIRPN